jgi:hypothetical protein
MIWGEMCVLSLMYSYVAVCMFCAVGCVIIIIGYSLLFSNSWTYVFFNILHMSLFLVCMIVFSLLYVLCIASLFVFICPFPIFVQVYRPLLEGGNPIAVNKFHISYHII